jgi:metal-responsive CopG/Arc/MetJ family transcriptional regulator
MVKEIKIKLSEFAYEELNKMKEKYGDETIGETIRKGIALRKYIKDKQKEGYKLQLKGKYEDIIIKKY